MLNVCSEVNLCFVWCFFYVILYVNENVNNDDGNVFLKYVFLVELVGKEKR